jgi:hypothetical protein
MAQRVRCAITRIKDAGATLLQHLVYLRLLATNGLRTVPIVTSGWDSRRLQRLREVAPELVVPDKSGGKIRDERPKRKPRSQGLRPNSADSYE